MSFQFGTWYFVGPRPLADVLSAVGDIASCHAPDGLSSYKNDGLSVLFGAFQTTKEAGREKQPPARAPEQLSHGTAGLTTAPNF